MKRLALVLLIPAVALLGFKFSAGPPARTYKAQFSRAVQVFPGVHVRVLGVSVGTVTDIGNVKGAVEVTFRIDDAEVRIPADVKALVVPSALLGERYIQLLPAYQGGPELREGGTITLEHTAVPAEPDELIRSLQDYMGALDPDTITRFVENLAQVLEGNGETLNSLIKHGASVLETVSDKREDLSHIFVELNVLTQALATRQEAIASLIHTYGDVTGTLNDNRAALEGTIQGLNEAASNLADLLTEHEAPLQSDLQTFTRTAQTLVRNLDNFTLLQKWSASLFDGASRAVDYDEDWLRLGNQGQELGALILLRIQERLVEICADAGMRDCANPTFWEEQVPSLFCRIHCPPPRRQGPGTGKEELTRAIESQPELSAQLGSQAEARGTDLDGLTGSLLDETVGNPLGMGGGL